MRWKVFCNDDLSLKPDALASLRKVADIDYFRPERNALLKHIGSYDAYFASAAVRADEAVLRRAKRLKVIATASTGTDHIDRAFAKERGIDILDLAKEYGLLKTFSATAELSWGLLLACIRQLPWAFEDAKCGKWSRQKFTGFQLLGKTLGILGFGRLGSMMASFGKAFGMRVIACDLRPISCKGVKQVDFKTLLKNSDVLTIHIHLNTENTGFISRSAFSKMKKGIVLINTSRGGVIDEPALLDSLKSGKVAAAGLDVIRGEWRNDLKNHPLIKYSRKHNNLIITPHIGGSTVESIIGAKVFMADKLALYIKERIK